MFEWSDRSADWATMTYADVQDVAERDGSILIVPVGSIEQHGHHLPTGTDTILVTEMAHLSAERTQDDVPVVVLPPIWSGYSPHHLSLGGTVSLDLDVLRETLENLADTALENGFDCLLLLNGHGGNASLVSSAVSTIGTSHADTEVLGVTYFKLAASFIDEIRESDVGGMAHAGEFETSLMLHLHPELVREDRLDGTQLKSEYEHGLADMFQSGPLSAYRPFEAYSESGAIGNPELASAEKGERIYKRLGDELETVVRQLHQRLSDK